MGESRRFLWVFLKSTLKLSKSPASIAIYDMESCHRSRSRFSFILYSKPTSDGDTLHWLPYDRQHRRYLSLNVPKPVMLQQLRAENVAFWNRLLPSLLSAFGSLSGTSAGGGVVATERAGTTRPGPDGTTATSPPITVELWVVVIVVGLLMFVIVLLTGLVVRSTVESRRRGRSIPTVYLTKQ